MKITLSVAMAALLAGTMSGQPAQAQSVDQVLRSLLGLGGYNGWTIGDDARHGWYDDDDDDGGRAGWADDDDDDGYGARAGVGSRWYYGDDDDDAGRGGDDDDD
jgi:hypothetical protein